jgi:hypothetical protein
MLIPRYNGLSTSITEFSLFIVTKDTIEWHSNQPFYHDKLTTGDMLKFSPDGTYFSCSKSLYSFNRKTGAIALEYQNTRPNILHVYSSAFSPDSKKWYTNEVDTSRSQPFILCQYDLEYDEVASSRRDLLSSKDFNAMMLGPDSMIYLSGYQRPYVSRIEQPNKRISVDGNECELVVGAVALSKNGIGGVGTISFPNNMEGLPDIAVTPDYRYAVDDCSIVTFESNQCCAASYL